MVVFGAPRDVTCSFERKFCSKHRSSLLGGYISDCLLRCEEMHLLYPASLKDARVCLEYLCSAYVQHVGIAVIFGKGGDCSLENGFAVNCSFYSNFCHVIAKMFDCPLSINLLHTVSSVSHRFSPLYVGITFPLLSYVR